jgi:hypothetical protein
MRHMVSLGSSKSRHRLGGAQIGLGEVLSLDIEGVPACNQRITSRPRRRSTYFCRKTPAFFDVDVYRKSTGELASEKSLGKNLSRSFGSHRSRPFRHESG